MLTSFNIGSNIWRIRTTSPKKICGRDTTKKDGDAWLLHIEVCFYPIDHILGSYTVYVIVFNIYSRIESKY